MFVFGKLVRLCVAASVAALAACQSTGQSYLRNGVGVNLPAGDIAAATRLQNAYFNHLCQQAGLTDGSFTANPGTCTVQPADPGGWTLIVRQGMNDIDRRCDAYLEWLDNQKRSKGPLLSQISTLQSATTAIMSVVDPGSTAALNIVVQAFGLLSKSIENYHSRLLLEIESSTINSVVLRARHDFRRDVQGKSFANRPDAEYALREYLRRCLPFAIETQINDLSTLGSRGIEATQDNTIFQEPIGSTILRDTPASSGSEIRPSKPLRGDGIGKPGGADPGTMAQTRIEKSLDAAQIAVLQRKLCVAPSGKFDSATRQAIEQAQSGLGSGTANGKIQSESLLSLVGNTPEGCSALAPRYANAFEKFHFISDQDGLSADKIKQFQAALDACVPRVEAKKAAQFPNRPQGGSFASGVLDNPTRDAIIFVLPALGAAAGPSGALNQASVDAIEGCFLG